MSTMKRMMMIAAIGGAFLHCGDNRTMSERQDIDSVLATHAPSLMTINGVVGVYRGQTEEGEPRLVVMVKKKTEELERKIPASLGGYPVHIEETGEIRPLNQP